MVDKIKAIEIKYYIGKEFKTPWIQVTQEAIDKFADLTKDHQFIHVNPEMAKRSIYGQTVAHGFYVLSLLGFFTLQDGERESMQFYVTDAKSIINYGFDKDRISSIKDRITVIEKIKEWPSIAAVMQTLQIIITVSLSILTLYF